MPRPIPTHSLLIQIEFEEDGVPFSLSGQAYTSANDGEFVFPIYIYIYTHVSVHCLGGEIRRVMQQYMACVNPLFSFPRQLMASKGSARG